MFIMISVFVGLIFLADIPCAKNFEVKLLEIGAKGTIPCGNLGNDGEIRVIQWFKSKSINEFENGDDSLAWRTEEGAGSLPNYYLENTTFSLVIGKAKLETEWLYKCTVFRGDLFTQSNFYISTVTYALPRKDPEIIVDTDLNRVNCTIEHVKPLIFPVFNFDSCHASTETYAFLNEDGTYTTSVSCALPETKSAPRVECSFSYRNYQRVGSLDLSDTTTDSLMKYKTTTVSPMGTSVTFAGDVFRKMSCTAEVVPVCGIIIGLLAVAIFIMLITWIKYRGKYRRDVQNCNMAKESEAMVA